MTNVNIFAIMIKAAVISPKFHLRASGFIEGISYIVLLFIAMPLKYMADSPEAVRVVGMAHGILFCWYVMAIVWARLALGFSYKNSILAFIASLIPFGTFIADKKLFKDL